MSPHDLEGRKEGAYPQTRTDSPGGHLSELEAGLLN